MNNLETTRCRYQESFIISGLFYELDMSFVRNMEEENTIISIRAGRREVRKIRTVIDGGQPEFRIIGYGFGPGVEQEEMLEFARMWGRVVLDTGVVFDVLEMEQFGSLFDSLVE